MFPLGVLFFFLLFQYLGSTDVSKACNDLRETFSDASSQFFSCAILNSRPITLCESCIDSYLDVINSYHNMTKLRENGTKCIDNYINLDRLQIIETLYDNSISLWNRAKCYECFQREKGKITPKRSNETLQFNTYFNRLMVCINHTTDALLCSDCLYHYLELNNYYISISNENEKIGVCMDIVDMMNDTRIIWSKKCCSYRKHDEYIFLATTSVVLIITAAFYIFAQLYTVKKTPAILQQRRLAESLNQADVPK